MVLAKEKLLLCFVLFTHEASSKYRQSSLKRKTLLLKVAEHPLALWPDICNNLSQMLLIICQLLMKIVNPTVIFRKYLALAQA